MLGISSFQRDYNYNEKRYIINPIIESSKRMYRFSASELELEITASNFKVEKYADFHHKLDRTNIEIILKDNSN